MLIPILVREVCHTFRWDAYTYYSFHLLYIRKKQKNSIWLANCGSGYKTTLLHTSKQYGLLDINLHIWSDSEIKVEKYEKLIKEAKAHMNINSATVYYNSIAEDFGYSKNQIQVEQVSLI